MAPPIVFASARVMPAIPNFTSTSDSLALTATRRPLGVIFASTLRRSAECGWRLTKLFASSWSTV